MGEVKKLGEKLIFEGSAVSMYKEKLKLPNGNIVEWDLLKHSGGAGIVPVLDDGKILLVKQYRNTVDEEIFEIPAGKRNPGDDFLQCAMRELEEETGYRSEHFIHLQNAAPAIGYSDEIIGLYAATNLIHTKQHLDEDEFIDVYSFELDEIINMILSGEIQDSKTVVAIMLYKEKLLRNEI